MPTMYEARGLDPRRALRLPSADIADAVMLGSAIVGMVAADDWRVRALFVFPLAWHFGATCFRRYREASAYRHGWLDGRAALYRSADEATRRGMTGEAYSALEVERDRLVWTIDHRAGGHHDEHE